MNSNTALVVAWIAGLLVLGGLVPTLYLIGHPTAAAWALVGAILYALETRLKFDPPSEPTA